MNASCREGSAMREMQLSLGELRRAALQSVPGQKIACVTDVACHARNLQRIRQLSANADLLFIEATFLERDVGEAALVNEVRSAFRGVVA